MTRRQDRRTEALTPASRTWPCSWAAGQDPDDHPEVRIICRDRAASFRDGAQAGAPQARQVADAWHLLNNLAQAAERVMGRDRTDLRQPVTPHHGRTDDAPMPEGHGRTGLDSHGLLHECA
ncbi:transposase [Streptomyces sp. NPDC059525]|uniref:transposase n=1 Tax=Streptomyces sp. NPDC059525 TaxID=3346857 RepID=UPI0036A0EA13